jgi:hypothetical protein
MFELWEISYNYGKLKESGGSGGVNVESSIFMKTGMCEVGFHHCT